MAIITTVNKLVERKLASGNYNMTSPIRGDFAASRAATVYNNTGHIASSRLAYIESLPTLPSGVTSFIPTYLSFTTAATGSQCMVAEMINLGIIDLSVSGSGCFTDGNAMPTRTIGNTTTQTYSPLILEAETLFTGTEPTLTITYTDDQGNTGNVTTGTVPTASAIQTSASIIGLNTTDIGVTDVTAASTSGGSTPVGKIRLWGYIPIATFTMQTTLAGSSFDFLNYAYVPRLGASAQLAAWSMGGVGATASFGDIYWVGDT